MDFQVLLQIGFIAAQWFTYTLESTVFRNMNYVGNVKHKRSPEDKSCPPKWVKFEERCFMLGTRNLTFEQAEEYCKAQHKLGHLASIHSTGEQNVARDFLKGGLERFWIGLTTNGESKHFGWSDRTEMDFTQWGPLEPNDLNPYEHCGEVMGFPGWNGRWNNVGCQHKAQPLCASPPHLRSTALSNCSEPYDSFVKHGTICYAYFENTTKSWQEAEEHCQSLGSHLVSVVDSTDENFFLLTYDYGTSNSMWIGLRSEKNEPFDKWTDGNPVIFTQWGYMEPHRMVSERCAALYTSQAKWFTDKCDTKKSFMCKHNLVEMSTPDPPVSGVCPHVGWTDFGGSFCYKIEKNSKKSWIDAQKDCHKQGAFLASIHNQVENSLISMLIGVQNEKAWIGFHRPFHNDSYRWSDWTSVDFAGWDEGEPSKQKKHCVESSLMGSWNDRECTSLRPYVCKIRKVPERSTQATETVYDDINSNEEISFIPLTRPVTMLPDVTSTSTAESKKNVVLPDKEAMVSGRSSTGILWSFVAVVSMGFALYVYYLAIERKMLKNLAATDTTSRVSLGSIAGSIIYEKSDDEGECE